MKLLLVCAMVESTGEMQNPITRTISRNVYKYLANQGPRAGLCLTASMGIFCKFVILLSHFSSHLSDRALHSSQTWDRLSTGETIEAERRRIDYD